MSTRRVGWLAVGLGLCWLALIVLQLGPGTASDCDLPTALRGALAVLGVHEPLGPAQQTIAELRLWRALATGLVGAALALAGALLQGLFRNGLAEPSILGVSAGASLGAVLGILLLGGYGPDLLSGLGRSPVVVTALAFVFALATVLFVATLAGVDGRVSVPTLLLAGIAVNACIGGLLAAIQSVFLADFEVSRAMMSWTFGSLADRQGHHVAIVAAGLAIAAAAVPFVARELDLLAAGEDDAHALGVPVARTKALALAAAAAATACAIAVAGQIAFVGLIVPHVVRLLGGRSHRALLPLSVLAGAVVLLGTDWLQRVLLGARALQPGVVMSLLGGPFFLYLLARHRREV